MNRMRRLSVVFALSTLLHTSSTASTASTAQIGKATASEEEELQRRRRQYYDFDHEDDAHQFESTHSYPGTGGSNAVGFSGSHVRRNRQLTLAMEENINMETAPPASTSVPLHATTGTHHVYVYVGSPPQRQTLIVDTGSRQMAFPCRDCLTCGKHASASFYDPGHSTTDALIPCDSCRSDKMPVCQDDKCVLFQRYTEGSSWTAYELEDLVWMGTADTDESLEHHLKFAVPHTFGCQTEETGLFRTQYADGILGLSMHPGSIINSIYESGSMDRLAFSLCFTRTGGHLSLGGTSNHHHVPMKFSPLRPIGSGTYSIPLLSMHLGGILLTTSDIILDGFRKGKGTIIDSGTTDTYLPFTVTNAFHNAFTELTGTRFTNKMKKMTYEDFLGLPDIVFEFEGSLEWLFDPASYMEATPLLTVKDFGPDGKVKPWEGTRDFTARVYLDEPLGAVLGANAMTGHDIFFDIQGQKVGIAKADCG